VGVPGHQAHPGKPAGNEVGEERVPRGPGLAGGDFQPEDFAAPIGIDPGRDQHDGVDNAAAFADFHREGVGGDERE
jgi:hypothetical protein